MMHPSERAQALRDAATQPRPGSIEEAEALDQIDTERWREERDDERTRKRRERHWDDDG